MRDVRHRLAIEELIAAFFWKIDRRNTQDIATLFTEAGELIIPDLSTRMTTTTVVRGRDALTLQWANRPSDLTTRHVYTNLLVTEVSETEARGQSVGIGFRHVGSDFGLPVPVIVADHDDVYEYGSDGRWRFRVKRITPVFVSPQLFPG